MKLITETKLSKKEYLNCELRGSNIVVLKNGDPIGEVKASSKEIKAFNNRNPKLAVKNINDDGSYELVLVRWVDIHGHTEYSLLDGAVRIKDKAEKTEYAAAITDHGVMHGIVKYYKEMEKQNKHAIIGVEAYVETIDGAKKGNHLILLAKNQKGYENLLKLSLKSYKNFYRKPHVSYETLKEHSEGLIATSACLGGEIPQAILSGDLKKAEEILLFYKEIFKDDFYLEIQRHNIGEEEDLVNKGLVELSEKHDIKLVAGIDSHYVNKEDREVQEILLCLQTGKTLQDEDRMVFEGEGYHIHTADEVDELFKDIPEALDNTLEIGAKCQFDLELGNIKIPHFDVPEKHNEESYLNELVMAGFEEKFDNVEKNVREKALERVEYELKIINDMGYPGYFLIVSDFIRFAKDNGIYVGPGRGSAVGSLVSYCLDIIELNPLDYDLLFERFLNPERVTMPDIDIDFCYERREEVIDYIKSKYGVNSVSRIATFTTLAPRGAVRDVTRVLGLPYALGDEIANAIPEKPGMTFNKAFEESKEFLDIFTNNKEAKRVIDIAMRLEGIPRNTSVHACGVIIAPGPVDNYLPTFIAKADDENEAAVVSQVVMSEVEELGLLKMDILGLKTMTALAESEVLSNEKDSVDYNTIPLNDPYVYEDISKGKSYGVFQLESPGMREFMTSLYSDVGDRIKYFEEKYNTTGFYKVSNNEAKDDFIKDMQEFGNELFERLIAGLSLYRPGPMDYIPNYLEGIKHPDKVKYLTPELEPILAPTYGVIVYQEQVMRIVQELGGFSLGGADLLRRAMGKKQGDDVMEEYKKKFIHGEIDNKTGEVIIPGCLRNGINYEVAEEIWHQMEDFNKYAFNKSHAAGYAFIAIKTAWFKYYYPVEFMTSTLNAYLSDPEKGKTYLNACRESNIPILPPNINHSKDKFAKVDEKILIGFKGIKGINAIAPMIEEERNRAGKFKDVQDFVERMYVNADANKSLLEGLILTGAFDSFGYTRASLLHIVPQLMEIGKKERKQNALGQVDLFSLTGNDEFKKLDIPEIDEIDRRQLLESEREYTGYYLTAHPLDEFRKFYKDENIKEIVELIGEEIVDEITGEVISTDSSVEPGEEVKVAGIIRDSKIIYTKNNKVMATLKIEDMTGTINSVIFPTTFSKFGDTIINGAIVLIEGTFRSDDFGPQIIIESIVDLERVVKAERAKSISAIRIYAIDKKQLEELRGISSTHEGNIPVYINFKKKYMKFNKSLKADLSTILYLRKLFGADAVDLINSK